MAAASLICTDPQVTLELPWWPTEITETASGWNVEELDRPGQTALAVLSTRTARTFSIGFTLRHTDYTWSIKGMLADLRKLSRARKPSTLVLGQQSLGLFRLEPPQITVIESAVDGSPSVADVSLTLVAASDAEVNVGPIKFSGRARNMARRA